VTWDVAGKIVVIIRDIVTGAAAMTVAIVAVKGLSTWKRQLFGNANYELARRLLRATYKLREAIRYVRMPMMSNAEIAEARKAAGSEVPDTDSRNGTEDERITFQARWRKISDALVGFDAELLEAEALWGRPIRELSEHLLKCVSELSRAIDKSLRGNLTPERDAEIIAIISDPGVSNPYADRLAGAIKGIEDELRKHLKP
jgi:hypothetical protein